MVNTISTMPYLRMEMVNFRISIDVDKQMQSIDILFKEIDGKKENLEHGIFLKLVLSQLFF